MSLLNRLFGRGDQQAQSHHALVMVLLPVIAPPDGRRVLDHLKSQWPDMPAFGEPQVDETATTVDIPGGALVFAHLPVPVPAGDLTGPLAVAWHWPEADDVVAAHQSHVLVHAASKAMDRLDVRLLVTRVAASIVTVAGASGVYVGDAMLVRAAADYVEDAHASSRHELPMLSWVGFNLVGEDDGSLSAYTTGLGAFDLQELEVRQTDRPHAELLGLLADLAHYQLVSGKELKDGDTFGASADDRTRVRYEESAFIPDMTVTLLALSPSSNEQS